MRSRSRTSEPAEGSGLSPDDEVADDTADDGIAQDVVEPDPQGSTTSEREVILGKIEALQSKIATTERELQGERARGQELQRDEVLRDALRSAGCTRPDVVLKAVKAQGFVSADAKDKAKVTATIDGREVSVVELIDHVRRTVVPELFRDSGGARPERASSDPFEKLSAELRELK